MALLPPCRYAILIRCESRSQDENQNFLSTMAQQLRQQSEEGLIDIWGPIPAPMERKAGRFQAHMVLLSMHRAKLHFYVQPWWQHLLHIKSSTMKITIDVDPQEFS